MVIMIYSSIRMMKLCGQSIVKPLVIIFKNCVIDSGIFPDIWKKSNIIPVHKKGDKQITDNYRLVSLLSICGKTFEKLLFNSIFELLDDNNILSSNHSCEYQLLSIAHIYALFDCCLSLGVRGICLDNLKHLIRSSTKA